LSVEFSIFNKEGQDTGQKLVIENAAFDIEPHDHSLYLAVKAEMANSRQGTSSTKTRAEVAGGGRKPWKQKGRGGARAGSRRSPVWVGGGRAFGPTPRAYTMKVNKKVKRLARTSALAYKYHENAIRIMDDLSYSDIKSKNIRQLLDAFQIEDKKVTILASNLDENLFLSCRNFYNIFVIEAESASAYDLMDCEVLLVEKDGMEKLNDQLLANN